MAKTSAYEILGRKMIPRLVNKAKLFFNLDIEHEQGRTHAQFLVVFGTMCFVSFFMTALNIFTGWFKLCVITAVFGTCCALDMLIELQAKTVKAREFGRTCFIVETMMMCTAFLIFGEPEGFSILWVLLLPACGFFLFRLEYGTIITTVQWLILVFLLWTPWGRGLLQYDYTLTFMQRFPIIFLAFAGVGILLEFVRLNGNEKLKHAKEEYEYMYKHDALTGLFNRYGFTKMFRDFFLNREGDAFAFAIFDLDHFKNVNDTYGHLNGDEVLKMVAHYSEEYFGEEGIVCRWGGEEFAILIKDAEKARELCEGLLDNSRVRPIKLLGNDGEIIIPFSMGLTKVGSGQEFDDSTLFALTDSLLYKAKENGRNRIEAADYLDFTEDRTV